MPPKREFLQLKITFLLQKFTFRKNYIIFCMYFGTRLKILKNGTIQVQKLPEVEKLWCRICKRFFLNFFDLKKMYIYSRMIFQIFIYTCKNEILWIFNALQVRGIRIISFEQVFIKHWAKHRAGYIEGNLKVKNKGLL